MKFKIPGKSSGSAQSRTPHGVRGLKSTIVQNVPTIVSVAPHTGCVD